MQIWMTTAVAVLPPGWVSEFRQENGPGELEPCPALLLEQDLDDPQNTRVVFASADGGHLVAACDAANYVGTRYVGTAGSRGR